MQRIENDRKHPPPSSLNPTRAALDSHSRMLPSIPKGAAFHQNSPWEPKTHIAARNGGISAQKKKRMQTQKKLLFQNRWRACMLFFFFSLISTKWSGWCWAICYVKRWVISFLMQFLACFSRLQSFICVFAWLQISSNLMFQVLPMFIF